MLSMEGIRMCKSFGIHPWYAGEWDLTAKYRLESILESDSGACVGEIGLDCKHGDMSDQLHAFEEQMCVASAYGRVASIHMVGPCEKNVLNTIRDVGKGCPGIILHSFSGQEGYLRRFIDVGCYFSISPRLIYGSERKAHRILSSIPIDRLLVETDHPHSGKIFESMTKLITSMASLMDVDPQYIAENTADNLRRLIDRD